MLDFRNGQSFGATSQTEESAVLEISNRNPILRLFFSNPVWALEGTYEGLRVAAALAGLVLLAMRNAHHR